MSHQPGNIFAGTQVVSLDEVGGTNNSLVHPRGAVGVITPTPTGDQNQFLVRFPDDFEASFTREKLKVLKHFKDRFPGTDTTPGFDLEPFIICRCVVGSRAYWLDNDDSETGGRGIYLASTEPQWSLFGAPEQALRDKSGDLKKRLADAFRKRIEKELGADAIAILRLLSPLHWVAISGKSPDLPALLTT